MAAHPDLSKVDASGAADVFAGTQYRVISRIGRGGMGEVFHVVHEGITRGLAAKVLYKQFAGDAQLLERVRIEAQVLGSLRHDNVVDVTDYFQQTRDGRPFFVMEYLTGRTLQEELAEGGVMSLFDVVDFVHQALSGLVAVHALGAVHRDIKPDNLFLAKELDDVITVKLLDFGLARVIAGVSDEAPEPLAVPTETGAVLGTPRYLSPEAALGKRVDHRADLYSMAVVFYEMVAGCGPFEHLKHDFLTAHTVENPAPPSRFAKRPVPAEFDAVILRGLRKAPEDRYQTAEEFQLELERLWALINHPAPSGMLALANEDPPHFRTTGQLKRLESPPSRPFEPAPSTPAGQARSAALKRRPITPAGIALFVLITAVTAIAMIGLVAAVLTRTTP